MTVSSLTIARPYANAVFQHACQQDAVLKWSNVLARLAGLVQVPVVKHLLSNPRFSSKQLGDVITALLGNLVDVQVSHFISILAENRRFSVLPEVRHFYELLRADYEKVVQVDVLSFAVLSEQEKTHLTEALTKRLQRQVTLNCQVDKNLLGGAVVKAGDFVINRTVRGQLDRLAKHLATDTGL